MDKAVRYTYRALLIFPVGLLLISLVGFLYVKSHFGYVPCYDCIYELDAEFAQSLFLNGLGILFIIFFFGSMYGAFYIFPPLFILNLILLKTKTLRDPIQWKLIATCVLVYVSASVLMNTEPLTWFMWHALD